MTAGNLRVLRALRDVQSSTGGYPPTVRELCGYLGLSSTASVQHHINQLAAAGLVERRGTRRVITSLGHSTLSRETLAA